MVADDRGQLILVGAIAIALILLGLVLIVNTALFTQVVGSEGTVETAKDGGVSGQEVGNAIGEVVAEENRDGGGISSINSSVDTAVSNQLQSAYANQSFESGGAFVSIDYLGQTETGSRIAQESVGDFRNDDGAVTWDPIENSESGDLGRFFLTIHADQGSGGTVQIDLHQDGGPDEAIELNVDTTAEEVTVDVDGGPTCRDVSATNGTVRLDLFHGRLLEDGTCTFDVLGTSESNYWIEYSGDLQDVEGTYSIVTNSSVSDDVRYDDTSGPEVEDAIWSFAYEFTYDTNAATVTSDPREVEVYD